MLNVEPLPVKLPDLLAHQDIERGLLSIYTTRCAGGNGTGIECFLPPARTSYYSYGRQALAEGLRRIGVRPDDQVLIPGFICPEILSSLEEVGARAVCYDVDDTLHVDVDSLARVAGSHVRAVVAVNYFGFPQPLEPFREWCRARGATLIEDNAHGFLSRVAGVPLGHRGDIGVFSLRKTLAIPNGAALVDNRFDSGAANSGSQYDESPWKVEAKHRIKSGLKRVLEFGSLHAAGRIVMALRRTRLRGRSAVGGARVGGGMPREAFSPLAGNLLRRCDLAKESARRRTLYRLCDKLFADTPGVRPLLDDLPEGVVPYGYPFVFEGEDLAGFIAIWLRRGLQLIPWPGQLPPAIRSSVRPHYQRIVLVPFLW